MCASPSQVVPRSPSLFPPSPPPPLTPLPSLPPFPPLPPTHPRAHGSGGSSAPRRCRQPPPGPSAGRPTPRRLGGRPPAVHRALGGRPPHMGKLDGIQIDFTLQIEIRNWRSCLLSDFCHFCEECVCVCWIYILMRNGRYAGTCVRTDARRMHVNAYRMIRLHTDACECIPSTK